MIDDDQAAGSADRDRPDWWRQNQAEFLAHGLGAYRPSRLWDGTVTRALVERLEADHDVEIRLRSINPQAGNDWELLVDGTVVASIERVRTTDPTIVYAIGADQFRRLVASAADR